LAFSAEGHLLNGTIQGLLEMLKIPYTGSSVLASALAMDKVFSKQIFSHYGLPVPDSRVFSKGDPLSLNLRMRLPVIVKPADQGSAIGVRIVDKRPVLTQAVKCAFRYSMRVMIEEYIRGKEISVGILDGNPLPVIEIVPKRKFYDFKAKYIPGMSEHIIPARITKAQYVHAQRLAQQAHHVLGCSGATRVDMMMKKNGKIFILEVNTIPGMTETSLLPDAAKQAGIDFHHLVAHIILSAFAEYHGCKPVDECK